MENTSTAKVLSEEDIRREFTGKVRDFESVEEKKEHQKGLKIYMQGNVISQKDWPSRAERRKARKKK